MVREMVDAFAARRYVVTRSLHKRAQTLHGVAETLHRAATTPYRLAQAQDTRAAMMQDNSSNRSRGSMNGAGISAAISTTCGV